MPDEWYAARAIDTRHRMLFTMPHLIHYISLCALEAGDVILTGTPCGGGMSFDPIHGYLQAGVVDVESARGGLLRSIVADNDD